MTPLQGIKVKPRASEKYGAYAAFPRDVGRVVEAEKMKKTWGLRSIH
jgi:hypothetical protein